MKPKLNTLTVDITCNEVVSNEFPALRMGIYKEIEVFDATDFCEEEDIEMPNYGVFFSHCSRAIHNIMKSSKIEVNELFYQNPNGHILLHSSLTFQFIQYVMPHAIVYFEQILLNYFTTGIVIGTPLLYSMADAQMPTDKLQELLARRKDGMQEQDNTGV